MSQLPGDSALEPLAARVAEGALDPYAAADELLDALADQGPRSGQQADHRAMAR